jgi:hypothetical protein
MLGPSWELDVPFEAEEAINVVKELDAADNLVGNLILPAKDVCIILLKPADSCQARERTTDLIPMEHSKICNSNR